MSSIQGVWRGVRRLLGPSPRRLAVASGAPLIDLSSGPSRADAHELYHRARDLGPVCVNAACPEFVIVGHDAATWALKHPQVLSSACTADFDPLVVGNDPPAQVRWRKILARAMASCDAAMVGAFTRRWLDAFFQRTGERSEGFDAVHDLGCPLPEAFTGMMLGLTEEETRDLVGMRPRNRTRLNESWRGVTAGLRKALAAGNLTERTGVLAELASMAGPECISDDEIIALLRLVWFAGTSTSTHFLPSLLLLMLKHPGVMAELRERTSLAPAFVNEALRMEGPTGTLPRLAVSDFELMGVRVSRGCLVKISLLAANRDPQVFSQPDEVCLEREGTSLAFGYGVHFCLGAMIAKTMAATVVEAFVSRYPGMRVEQPFDEVQYERSEEFRSLKSLRVGLS